MRVVCWFSVVFKFGFTVDWLTAGLLVYLCLVVLGLFCYLDDVLMIWGLLDD